MIRTHGHHPTIGQQLYALKALYPESVCRAKNGMIRWKANIKPGPLCDEYSLRIIWDGRSAPVVWAGGGAISRCDDLSSVPHKFRVDKSSWEIQLCLQKNDWKGNHLIAETFVPWAMEWLVHFELWLATGEWLGGGVH